MRSLEALLYLEANCSALEGASERAVVAIDILRATTTIAAALSNGAAAVIPALTPEEAARLRSDLEPGTLLCGERGGVKPPGFDLGNSPLEYTRGRAAGRSVCFTTTNGTRLIRAADGSRRLLSGAFANIGAVCAALEADGGDVLLACAGTEGRFTMEDALFAGACVSRLRGSFARIDDAALAAEALWLQSRSNLLEALCRSRHGQTLLRLGFAADLEYAARLDAAPVLPTYTDGRFSLEFG